LRKLVKNGKSYHFRSLPKNNIVIEKTFRMIGQKRVFSRRLKIFWNDTESTVVIPFPGGSPFGYNAYGRLYIGLYDAIGYIVDSDNACFGCRYFYVQKEETTADAGDNSHFYRYSRDSPGSLLSLSDEKGREQRYGT
jgi:hypothetical protein